MQNHTFAIDIGAIRLETLQSVSGLTYGQDVIEVKQMTPDGEPVFRKQPGSVQSGEVTITRGMDKSEAFTNWIKQTRQKHDFDSSVQNVTIALLDAQQSTVRRYHLVGSWASGTGIETVTIQFDDMVIE
ncbi:phage tail protein [Streptomyces sp. 8N706]|uniref:phage tail protein n=1 Tax=Streptomyces sp. 8N706 TaxID=3457416 RepID=UPI003FD190CE